MALKCVFATVRMPVSLQLMAMCKIFKLESIAGRIFKVL